MPVSPIARHAEPEISGRSAAYGAHVADHLPDGSSADARAGAPAEDDDRVATPPRPPRPTTPGAASLEDDGLDPDFPDIEGVDLHDHTLAFPDARTLTLLRSTFRGGTIAVDAEATLDAQDAVLHDMDLTGRRIEGLVRVRFERCRLSGVDFGAARLLDVAFVDCTLELASARTTTFERVEILGGTIDGLDLTGATLTDVTFDRVALAGVSMDRVRLDKVDLRGADLSSVLDVSTLKGATIAEHQAIALAGRLARAAGVTVAVDRDT